MTCFRFDSSHTNGEKTVRERERATKYSDTFCESPTPLLQKLLDEDVQGRSKFLAVSICSPGARDEH